jgi:choline dehydrogenase-like flavoprotein
MAQRIVIVGAGLAGSILTAELAQHCDVTVVELSQKNSSLALPLTDVNWPAGLDPHVGSGPGGTTALWNNGLIELEADDYANWPLGERELLPYLSRAYPILAGVSRENVLDCYDELRSRHMSRGIPRDMLGNGLYYPQQRRNLWQSLQVSSKPIRLATGRAKQLIVEDGRATGVIVERDTGVTEKLPADYVILSAGGLSTPLLIQQTAKDFPFPSFDSAGRYYIDHPMGMIAKIKLNTRLYDIWNYRQRQITGTLQTPIVVRDDSGLKASAFLRPASVVDHGDRRDRVQSVLVNLRNAPFKLSSLMQFATSTDDIRELISFKLGLQLPTDYYVLRLVASELPDSRRSIYANEATGGITRDWHLSDHYIGSLDSLLQQLVTRLGGMVVESRFFEGWGRTLHSAAHHSGTCRMSISEKDGVCDSTCGIHGVANAYICDGSVLPGTGYANTGLTIAALALRLSDHLKERFADQA